jgi:hypothetical protein
MAGKLRAFISSTMRDLVNERAEVVRHLQELNLEPVWAEELTPTGQGSWDRIRAAIDECDMFVLILGETYGWIPTSGPMAAEEKSVTELEFDYARSTGLPTLAFLKDLGPSSPSGTDDAERRDAFRAKVEDWEDGVFRGRFQLARDLAEQVGRAVADLITDRFRAAQLTERRREQPRRPPPPEEPTGSVTLPADLTEATANRDVVLLLGAGASLEAGMPSASMFTEAMAAAIKRSIPDYRLGLSGTAFNAVASDFEALNGSEALHRLAREIVEPGFTSPTPAHRIAGELFDTIVTTNYDRLLERALGPASEHIVIDDEASLVDLRSRHRLIKLHGSLEHPRTLVLTESELADLDWSRPKVWRAVTLLLRSSALLSIGSSLRDPSLIRLLDDCMPHLRGWVVMLDATEAERQRLRRWNLELVPGNASSILGALGETVSRLRRQRGTS